MVSGEYTMKTNKFGLALCAEEHLLAEKPLTRLEAMVLYGISNLTAIISKLRKRWMDHSISVCSLRSSYTTHGR